MISVLFKKNIWLHVNLKKDLKMCVCEDNFQMFKRLQLKSLKIHTCISSIWVRYTFYIYRL